MYYMDTHLSGARINKLHSVSLCYKLLMHVFIILTRGYIHVSAG